MAITATFKADFDQFVTATKSAEVALEKVEAGSAKVGSSLNIMSAASAGAAPKVGTLRSSLQSFDGVLAALGVNIGTEIRGLTDLGEAAGKTGTELGLVATAGLLVGAAFAGWKIGKQIDEWTGLSKKISEGTAAMLGWGNVAEQEMGAKWDTITLAVKHGAAATISYTDAIAFNTEWQKKQGTALVAATKAHNDVAIAMIELNSAGVGWQGTLDTINGSVVEAIKFYLAAGVSQAALATAYGLTAAQVKSVGSSMNDTKEALTRLNDEQERWDDLLKALDVSIGEKDKGLDRLYDKTVKQTEASLAEYEAQVKLNASWGLDAEGRLKVSSAAETLRIGLEALHRTKVDGISQTAQEQLLSNAYTKQLYDESAARDRSVVSAAGQVTAINSVTTAYYAQIDAAARAQAAIDPLYNVVGNRPGEGPGINGALPTSKFSLGAFNLAPFSLSGHAAGGPVSAGPAILHDNEYVVPEGGALVMRGGGGPSVVNHIYVNGTAQDVARQIADEVKRTLMASTKLVGWA